MTQTILLVEDDPDVGSVVRDLLVARGYATILVRSAPAALAILASTPVHLVLSDIRLNSHSGRWLVHQISVLYPALPYVLMSGYRDEDHVEPRVPAVFVAKPFTSQDLVAAFATAGLPQEQEPAHG